MVDTQAGAKPGYKVDEGKRRMDLVPPEAILSLADVLTKGAVKYPERNWEKGMDWGRVYGAAMRHMTAFWGGEDVDPESGQLHVEHALCCLAFLVTYSKREIGDDDRPITDAKANKPLVPGDEDWRPSTWTYKIDCDCMYCTAERKVGL